MKNKKTNLLILVAVVVPFVVIYGMNSFTYLSFHPHNWTELSRSWTAIFSPIVGVGCACLVWAARDRDSNHNEYRKDEIDYLKRENEHLKKALMKEYKSPF